MVHPDCRNHGIGSLLLAGMEERCPLARRFELFTGRESKRNHVFYTRRGYHPFKEEKIDEKLTLIGYEKMNFPG